MISYALIFLSIVVAIYAPTTTRSPQPFITTTHKHHGHHTGNTHAHNTGNTHAHHHHPTREPLVQENFLFSYDPSAHRVLVLSGKNCYLYNPSETEKMNIHDVHAFRTLEGNLINLIDSGASFQIMSHSDLALMSTSFGRKCHNNYNIFGVN